MSASLFSLCVRLVRADGLWVCRLFALAAVEADGAHAARRRGVVPAAPPVVVLERADDRLGEVHRRVEPEQQQAASTSLA